MPEQEVQLAPNIPPQEGRTWPKSIAIYGTAAVALIGSYIGAGYIADATYGHDSAAQLLESKGFENPRLLSKEIGFVSLSNDVCHTLDEVEYDFDVTDRNGSHVKMSVCRGLFKTSTIAPTQ